MDEVRGALPASVAGKRRRWHGKRVVAMLVAIVVAAAGSVALSSSAAAAMRYTCPFYAPQPGQLTIGDYQLQQEAAKIGVCFNTLDTILIINNTSGQPIRFQSATRGSTYVRIADDSSAAVQARNYSLRAWRDPVGQPGRYILAGERMQVRTSAADFSWQFDVGLAVDTVAVETAAGMAFGKLKKWAGSGSQAKAAAVTCASAAVTAGATAEDMNDVMEKLLLRVGPCASAVESAGVIVEKKTLLQRAKTLQSTLTKVSTIVNQVELADIFGGLLRAVKK